MNRENLREPKCRKKKRMKTRGAISLVATAESTAQKYTFSTRNITVVIENKLTRQFAICYLLKQDNFNLIKIASEREREREGKRVSQVNDTGSRNRGSRSKLTAHSSRHKKHIRVRTYTRTHKHPLEITQYKL